VKVIADEIETLYTEKGKQKITLTLTAKADISDLKAIIANGKLLAVEISKEKKKRSLDSNSYLWTLCQKIAEVIHTTKESVYQKFIKEVGQFEIVPIKSEAVERWIEVWNSKGLGWYAEVMEDSKLPGYKKVISYYGSSVYDQREMSVLLDEVVNQCKELDIEVLLPAEIQALKESWK
jgi:DNA-binding XRE family transcriptional regulator